MCLPHQIGRQVGEEREHPGLLAGAFWVVIAWLVVLSTFGGYGLYWLILRRYGVTRVNTLMFLMAPVTAIWGALMFDEPFRPQTVLGRALGLAAVAIVHRAARRPRPEPETPHPAHRGRRTTAAPGTGCGRERCDAR